MSPVAVPAPMDILYGHGVSLACGRDGQIAAEKMHGFFAGDTRLLSTYRISINGFPWQLLGRLRSGSASAQWYFQNPSVRSPSGDIPAGIIHLHLKRAVAGAFHDDLHLSAFPERTVRARITLHLDADFADIFDVMEQKFTSRLSVLRIPKPDGLLLVYKRGGFERGLRINLSSSGPSPEVAGAQINFDLELEPGSNWTCCLEAFPLIDGSTLLFAGDPHVPQPDIVGDGDAPRLLTDRLLLVPFRRGRSDLRSLAIPQPGKIPYLAAGVPWFFTLFGRDQLMTSLMTCVDGTWPAEGALSSLSPWQAGMQDDWRDAEPGKFPHELRRGERAFSGLIPHTPYYGTHDAPALYCLSLWQAWKWSGNNVLLESYLKHATAGLEWCEQYGDRDGDGLQEYGSRSKHGYYNQSWKDAGDAIVHADGSIAGLPLATVELQGYLYAAYLAMAEIYDSRGNTSDAGRFRTAARELRALVEKKFWMEDADCYAIALDGKKRAVRSIASNSGHLLWCGLPSRERAGKIVKRLLQTDMFSGWGLRTLSALNPAYNPLSYQRGSVWPFDTALCAAGFWRYGFFEEAGILLRSVLEAALAFEEERLPELFCGLDRSAGGPVPYERANSPQAWSAAVPLLAAQLVLGILPDAPNGCCFLSPVLPDWLSHLELKGLKVGSGTVDIRITGHGGKTVINELKADGIEIIRQMPEAPLWGEPVS